MTENKQYKVITDNFGEYLILRHDDSLVVSEIPHKAMAELFCDELNELNNEIKQLKKENKELTGKASSWKITASEEIVKQAELAKENVKLKQENTELKTFKDKVFDKINEYIETSDKHRKPIETMEYGDDLGYWNGVYQYMKRLKRELKE